MKLGKNLLCVALGAICFTSCQQKNDGGTDTGGIGALNSDTLSYKVAKQYVHNYTKRAGYVDSVVHGPGISKKIRMPNTRSVWFSLSRLKALVNKIDSEGGDGVRFYLAAYDSVYVTAKSGHTPPREYWDYNTLVMVSTKDSLNGKYHQDFYNNSSQSKHPKGIILTVGSAPENRGEMCPPPSNCYVTGATLLNP